MKSNTSSLLCIKLLVAFFSTFVINNLLIAQNRPQQNVYKVTVTNQYNIEKGQDSDNHWAIYQEVYDTLGRMHTEIAYDFNDHNPHNYCWHTFVGKLKTKSEYFSNEKLKLIEEFFYRSDSLLIKKTIRNVTPKDTSIFLILTFKYDAQRNPIEVIAKNNLDKVAYISKSTYNDKGKEITRKVKVKKNYYPNDSIIKLESNPVYDSSGKILGEQQTLVKFKNTKTVRVFKYSYNDSGLLVGIQELNRDGSQIIREEREYKYSRNRLSLIKYYNSNNVLFKKIGKRYEIYRTRDRRVREIDY